MNAFTRRNGIELLTGYQWHCLYCNQDGPVRMMAEGLYDARDHVKREWADHKSNCSGWK